MPRDVDITKEYAKPASPTSTSAGRLYQKAKERVMQGYAALTKDAPGTTLLSPSGTPEAPTVSRLQQQQARLAATRRREDEEGLMIAAMALDLPFSSEPGYTGPPPEAAAAARAADVGEAREALGVARGNIRAGASLNTLLRDPEVQGRLRERLLKEKAAAEKRGDPARYAKEAAEAGAVKRAAKGGYGPAQVKAERAALHSDPKARHVAEAWSDVGAAETAEREASDAASRAASTRAQAERAAVSEEIGYRARPGKEPKFPLSSRELSEEAKNIERIAQNETKAAKAAMARIPAAGAAAARKAALLSIGKWVGPVIAFGEAFWHEFEGSQTLQGQLRFLADNVQNGPRPLETSDLRPEVIQALKLDTEGTADLWNSGIIGPSVYDAATAHHEGVTEDVGRRYSDAESRVLAAGLTMPRRP